MVYQPHGSMAVWGAEFAKALEAMGSICRCNIHLQPHEVHGPNDVLSPELTASNAVSRGRVGVSAHSDVVWLEPSKSCWVPIAARVTSSGASAQEDEVTNVAVAGHGGPTWTGAIHGTVREAENIGATTNLLHTPSSGLAVHVVDASIIRTHLRRAQEALYRGIKGPTSHLVNQDALHWLVEELRLLPRRVGGPHHWVVRHSSHLSAVPLEVPAHTRAPPAHLMLPREHVALLVPDEKETRW